MIRLLTGRLDVDAAVGSSSTITIVGVSAAFRYVDEIVLPSPSFTALSAVPLIVEVNVLTPLTISSLVLWTTLLFNAFAVSDAIFRQSLTLPWFRRVIGVTLIVSPLLKLWNYLNFM